jgi:pyruvate dehydrogenase E2 component (dihydrolipoamide acetyltransferase)/2-oxoisovalerate dehydrogenase E2 component (dihydrolipoyl transacylase)
MDFHLPELGEGVYEAELVSWLVKPGDTVKRGQNLMEVLTDKATMEVPAAFAGRITELRAQPSEQIKVGDAVLTYDPVERPASGRLEPSETSKQSGDSRAPLAREAVRQVVNQVAAPPRSRVAAAPASVRAAPSVRYMARKLGIDLTQVHGSGPQGRILIEDLSHFVRPSEGDGKQPAAEPRPNYGQPGTRVKLHGLRRKIAEHMVQSKRTAPHYTYVDECDVTELVRLREQVRETYAQAGVRLTYVPFFVKAVVAALKEVPIVNASLDEGAGEIVLHDRCHVGIAVATPNGLIVPVIHDADRKDLAQIAREVERLSAEARAGKAKLEDLKGGTFTITSVGGIGGLISTPIINYPEVAILGIGKVVKRPVFDAAGTVRPADLVYLSLSFDHRVVDGAVGAAFCNAVIRQLQSPATLLLPEKLA